MFTGIVANAGRVLGLERKERAIRMTIESALDLSNVQLGDSIAVDGVCITVVSLDGERWQGDVSHETLRCTTLGERVQGDRVHLEFALRVGDPLGGHIVQGHVDCTGLLSEKVKRGEAWDLTFSLSEEFSPYVVEKGSIAVDGVSLTVNQCAPGSFGVTIIAHTGTHTHLLERPVGTRVNVETDILGKYAVGALRSRHEAAAAGLSLEALKDNGFA